MRQHFIDAGPFVWAVTTRDVSADRYGNGPFTLVSDIKRGEYTVPGTDIVTVPMRNTPGQHKELQRGPESPRRHSQKQVDAQHAAALESAKALSMLELGLV